MDLGIVSSSPRQLGAGAVSFSFLGWCSLGSAICELKFPREPYAWLPLLWWEQRSWFRESFALSSWLEE
jgi:hypothetical protein